MHVCNELTKKTVVSTRILWPSFVEPANWPNICWVLSVLLVTEETITNRTVSTLKNLAVWVVKQIDRWVVSSWWWVSCYNSKRRGEACGAIWCGCCPLLTKVALYMVFFSSFKHFKVLIAYKQKAMAPHSNTFAWKIPWMEESGGLQSMGSLGVGHDWATSLSLFTFMHWRRKWQPVPAFLPRESQGRGNLVGCRLWGCTESDTTEVT